jgi:hypothetical protein
MTAAVPAVQHAAVTLAGFTVDLAYCLNATEDRRRRAAGLVAVTPMYALNAFLAVPTDIPVDAMLLPPHIGILLERAPQGCVDFTPDGVVRLIVPPLVVESIEVADPTFEVAALRADRFATYCTRSVLVPTEPSAVELFQASFCGVGVRVSSPEGVRTVLEPEPFTGGYLTPAAWAFAEVAYLRLRELS